MEIQFCSESKFTTKPNSLQFIANNGQFDQFERRIEIVAAST